MSSVCCYETTKDPTQKEDGETSIVVIVCPKANPTFRKKPIKTIDKYPQI